MLALANVYGPRQDPHGEAGVVAIFADKLLDRERPVIFGDGSQTRDFVYVDDVVDAFVRAVDKGGGLTDEHRHRRRDERAAAVRRHGEAHRLPASPREYDPPRTGEVQRSALDPSRAEIHLGWKPWTALEEGVARTLEHFKGQRRRRRAASLTAAVAGYAEAADLVERDGRARPADVRGIGVADEHERVRQPLGRERERVARLLGAEDRRRDPARRETAVGRGRA